jgi:TolA-binding protein
VAALVFASGCLPSGDTGRLERQVQELKDELYVLQREREQTEARLRALEARLGIESRATVPPRQDSDSANSWRAEDRPQQPAVVVSREQPPAPDPNPAGPGDNALYREGVRAYEAGDYSFAVIRLEDFLRQHPSHAHALHAQFLIAESHFAELNFPQAIVEYQKVLRRDAQSQYAPAALYGIGLSYYELNYEANALAHFERLTREYPSSSQAREAEPLITKLKRRSR